MRLHHPTPQYKKGGTKTMTEVILFILGVALGYSACVLLGIDKGGRK